MSELLLWPGLCAFVRACTSLTVVQHEDDARIQTSDDPQARCDIRQISGRQIGHVPHKDYPEASDDGPLNERQTRWENITVRFRFESLDQRPGYKAQLWADRLAFGLNETIALASLAALDLSFGEVLANQPVLGESSDNLTLSVVWFDVRFAYKQTFTGATEYSRISEDAAGDVTET